VLNHSRWLKGKDPRDHIYAFLGHPSSQLPNGTPFIHADCAVSSKELYLKVAMEFLKNPLSIRVLYAVYHNKRTIADDFPSWVPLWDLEALGRGEAQNWGLNKRKYLYRNSRQTPFSFGIHGSYSYSATAGTKTSLLIEGRTLKLRGVIFDKVQGTVARPSYGSSWESLRLRFFPWWMKEETFEAGRYLEGGHLSFDSFLMTLSAGLSNMEHVEYGTQQLRKNFAALWNCKFTYNLNDGQHTAIKVGRHVRFQQDINLFRTGRSFLKASNHFALGPNITEPGDLCCILLGA
jgi:hypothetical protein